MTSIDVKLKLNLVNANGCLSKNNEVISQEDKRRRCLLQVCNKGSPSFQCGSHAILAYKHQRKTGVPAVLNHITQKAQCASDELIEYLQVQKITLAFDFQLHFYTGNIFGH